MLCTKEQLRCIDQYLDTLTNRFQLFFWKLQFIELYLEFYLRCNIFLYLLLMVLQIEMVFVQEINFTFVQKTMEGDAELLTFSCEHFILCN